jgi:plastocyanin
MVSASAALLALAGLLLSINSTRASAFQLVPDDQGGVTESEFKPVGSPLPVFQSKTGSVTSTVFVSITESGFDPALVTVTVGTTVVWTNHLQEAVHLVSGEPYRLYLPVVMRNTDGTRAATASLSIPISTTVATTTRQQYDWGNVSIAPGESYPHTFTLVGNYPHFLAENPGGYGLIVVHPLPPDSSVLAWATGEPGVLLRWHWPRDEEQPVGYNVYRDGSLLNTGVITYITDVTEAKAILGSHWEWLVATYPEVTNVESLHSFLSSNRLAEQWLADQRYPVALVRGLGYLDDSVESGDVHTYTYRAEAVLSAGTMDVGTVTVRHQGVTPLEPPSAVTATVVVSDGLRGSPDWAQAQKNRKAHGRVFLIWSLPEEPQSNQGPPEKWTTSYDVFRAGPVGPTDDPATMPYERITVEPVVPMADHDPVTPISLTQNGGDSYESVPYDRHSYYYADENLQVCQTYAYRVAPRDILGQSAQLSDYVTAIVPDTMPPAPPVVLTPTIDHTGGEITITWKTVTDAVNYHVYRSKAVPLIRQNPVRYWAAAGRAGLLEVPAIPQEVPAVEAQEYLLPSAVSSLAACA